VQSLPLNMVDLKGQIVVFAEVNGVGWWRVFLGLISAGAVPTPLDPGESITVIQQAAQSIGAAYIWHDRKLQRVRSEHQRSRTRTLALLKLTSGSTGIPRAFRFTAAQMLADGRQICATMGITNHDLNLAVIPFGHSYGLGNLVMPLIDQGTPILCATSALPQTLGADCAKWKPTVFPAVPAILRILVASDLPKKSLASIRLIISAGAILPHSTAQAFHAKFQLPIHGFYGSSETGGICYDRTGEATLQARSVGPPLDGIILKFRRGNRFTVSSAAVTGRGRFSPADRGELNPDGELVLLGRTGRTVKIAGRRLDLGEVETALRELPGVREALVTAHPQRPDSLAAAVASDWEKLKLRSMIIARLPAWKVPARLIIMKTFPTTARGKIDTRAVLERISSV